MMRLVYFLLVLIPVVTVTLYTVLKSRRLSDFLETLAAEHRSSKAKFAALLAVWKTKLGRES